MRKVIGTAAAAAVIIGAGALGSTWSAAPAEAATWSLQSSGEVTHWRTGDGGSWYDETFGQRGCRYGTPGCAGY